MEPWILPTLIVLTLLAAGGLVTAWHYRRQLDGMQAQEDDLAAARENVARLEVYQSQASAYLEQIEALNQQLSESERKLVEAEASVRHAEQRQEELQRMYADMTQQFKDNFAALSGDALQKNNEAFLTQAQEMMRQYRQLANQESEERQKGVDQTLAPIKDQLKELHRLNRELDQKREEDKGAVHETLRGLAEMCKDLDRNTVDLVKALQNPGQAGQFGEMILDNVLEKSGIPVDMIERQKTVSNDDGQRRPDAVVRMPGGGSIVVDAKATFGEYLSAMNCSDDEQRQKHLLAHSQHMQMQVTNLSKKGYANFGDSMDLVVMFIPSEGAYRAAIETNTGLFEYAFERNVMLATPTTLLPLLRAVAYGWRHERLAESAEEIRNKAQDFYDSVSKLVEHIAKLGRAMESSVRSYNDVIGSVEGRLIPKTRRLAALGIKDTKELPEEVTTLELPREIRSTVREQFSLEDSVQEG